MKLERLFATNVSQKISFDITEAEIAKLAASLVDNDYMNGECVRMDGAIRMQPR